ncbi:hypothetical protein [Streptomyces sp. NBC_00576]
MRTKNPTDADTDAIANVCRCGTYVRVRPRRSRAPPPNRGDGGPRP